MNHPASFITWLRKNLSSDNVYEKPEADTQYTASVTRQHSRYDKNINSPGGCGNTRYIDNLLHVELPVLYQIRDMARTKYSRYFFHDYKEQWSWTRMCCSHSAMQQLILGVGIRGCVLCNYSLTALLCYFCTCYSAVHGVWPEKDLAELADGPTGCSEVAKSGYLFAWNFCVTRSAVLTAAEERH